MNPAELLRTASWIPQGESFKPALSLIQWWLSRLWRSISPNPPLPPTITPACRRHGRLPKLLS